ncbi:MAG: hypothetical protein PQ964_04030 [Methanobacteriaceae archaeon]|jgi:NitT/TauT family transport system substrate-binding protein
MIEKLSTWKKLIAVAVVVVAVGAVFAFYVMPPEPELLPKLTIVGPPGPSSVPLAYMVEHNKLSGIAAETELIIFKDLDQLRAIVAGKQGDFVIMPSNVAAVFYNRDMDIQLLDISVWSALHI